MKLSKLHKTLLATAASAALALGASAPAMADAIAPTFTLNPAVFPGSSGQAEFTANLITGISSELLSTNATGGHAGSGWMQISGFKLSDDSTTKLLNSNATGLGNSYLLYLTYTLSDVKASGSTNGAGSANTLTALNFTFWVDPNMDTTFKDASVNTTTHTHSDAAVTGTTGDDIVLAYGSLVEGTAGFDAQGGAYLNSTQTFVVCTGNGTGTINGMTPTGALATSQSLCTSGVGNSFFALPQPFYGIALDEFNNTKSATIVDKTNGFVAIKSQATGGIDFAPVPEPGTLALLGLGLLGAGFNLRRRSK